METPNKIPFYAKAALIFIAVFAFVYTSYIGREIMVPIVYATILAILLNPFVNYLMRKRVGKVLAISFALALSSLVLFGTFYLISSQVTMFSDTYPQFKIRFAKSSTDLVHWIAGKFNMKESTINEWILQTQMESIHNLEIGQKLNAIGHGIVVILLLPVYLFLILFYKPLLLDFIRRLFQPEHHGAVVNVLSDSKKIIQSYLVGLSFEMIIVAVLNSAGLLVLGIDYAIILGITGAVLNIIPYLGGIVATALPMIIAFVTGESNVTPVLVLFLYIFIQLIDNNYIIPKIVASRVQINPLISIIVVLIGGAVWGIPGMFLSIPLTAILKVIFDHIEPLKPWGFLLGNIVPTTSKFSFIKPRVKK